MKQLFFVLTIFGLLSGFVSSQAQSQDNQGSGSFIDKRDGHEYRWIKIGEQVWMAENLAFLPEVSKPADLQALDREPQAFVYDYYGNSVEEAKSTENYQTYGVLYSWSAAMNGWHESSNRDPNIIQGACPAGWHVPSEQEWQMLESSLGMYDHYLDRIGWRNVGVGIQLKESNSKLWHPYKHESTNSSGFSARPGGCLNADRRFDDITTSTNYWSSTVTSGSMVWGRSLYCRHEYIYRMVWHRRFAFSVRCLKNN